MESSIAMVIQAKSKDLGDNFVVRRSLPAPRKRLVGPFIFWDHMGPMVLKPEKPMVVRAHPHIGLSTITYLFAGEITHRDSLNNELVIRPGEVNWMTAGRGIVHSERSNPEEPVNMEGIQLWVALPAEAEEVEPSFVHQKEKDLPMIERSGFQIRLIAGEAFGEKSPLPVFSSLYYMDCKGSAGSTLEFPTPQASETALYVINGKVKVEDQSFEKYSMVISKPGTPLKAEMLTDGEFMLFGGQVFPEGRHIWWNFVSSSKERIEQAKDDWRNDNYPPVINEKQKIPLPEN